MKTRQRMLCLLLCVLLAAGMSPAAAERNPWNCTVCGRQGNTGNFCGSCGNPAPAQESADGEPWTVLYKVYYRDEAGTLLNSETLTLSGSGTMTYMISADDTLVPSGYVPAGQDYATLTVENGRLAPSRVTFVYRPGTGASRVSAGEYVTFGHYPRSSGGKDSAPIEWLVLAADWENDRALLLSRYVLDARAYNETLTNLTWESCGLREWLNGEFRDSAFTAEEQSALLETVVDNSAEQGQWNTDGGANTTDTLFLLSCAEAARYLGAGGEFNALSKAGGTAYAVSRGLFVSGYATTEDGEPSCWWWLRSPGNLQSYAAYVDSGGAISNCSVRRSNGGVRPACWVDLRAGSF